MAKKESNTHEIVIKVEGKEWTDALDRAFQERVKSVQVDGFRKGKVPRDIYEKKFGKESLYFPASDFVVENAYRKALEESKLLPVVQPSVDIKSVDQTGIEFVFKIITKPEVKIKKYKGLKVKPEEVKVSKEEIEHEMGHLLERFTETRTKENGVVEKGNIAIIDFEGFKDGKPFAGGKAENYELEIGSNTFIPGFEDQLIGAKLNEEKDINVTFPKDYHAEELKGAKVVFKIKVNDIKEKLERKFDKELFEDLNIEGVDSKEKLEKHIKEDIAAQKEMEVENKYVDELLAAVAKNVEVDIPEEMVEEEIDRLIHKFEEQIKMQGINLEMYYEFTKTTEKDLRAQMEKDAYNHVLYRLMLEEILETEKVKVDAKEVDKEVAEMAKRYQMKEEDFLKAFGGKEMVQYDLEIRKVIELLKEYNK